MAHFVFLFLTRVIFWETLTEMDVNTVNVIFFPIVIAKRNLTWPVLISTIELTSKCLKRWSENTHLRLVVPLEFWTFWRDFYGRYEYRSYKIVVELLTLGRIRKFHTPTVVRGGGGEMRELLSRVFNISLLLTEREVCMGESWPRLTVQTERSEVCTSDRG